MSENREQSPDRSDEQLPAESDERAIDLSEGQRGIDVRPTSDPSAVDLPPIGGLAPAEAVPADAAPVDGQSGGEGRQGSNGGSDSET